MSFQHSIVARYFIDQTSISLQCSWSGWTQGVLLVLSGDLNLMEFLIQVERWGTDRMRWWKSSSFEDWNVWARRSMTFCSIRPHPRNKQPCWSVLQVNVSSSVDYTTRVSYSSLVCASTRSPHPCTYNFSYIQILQLIYMCMLSCTGCNYSAAMAVLEHSKSVTVLILLVESAS